MVAVIPSLIFNFPDQASDQAQTCLANPGWTISRTWLRRWLRGRIEGVSGIDDFNHQLRSTFQNANSNDVAVATVPTMHHSIGDQFIDNQLETVS